MAKQQIPQEQVGRWNLITGEDTYSGQNAQNPQTARRLLSLIPSLNGELKREAGEPTYLATNLGAKVGGLFQYDYNDTSGVKHSAFFAATSSKLFLQVGSTWVQQTLPLANGTTSSTPLTDYPFFVVLNNLLHFSDGVTNWIYDGPNGQFVLDGIPIPLSNETQVFITPGGNITVAVNLFYWITWADQTTGRVHESSSSTISGSIGTFSNQQITIKPYTGTVSTTSGSTAVVGSSTNFQSFEDVNMQLWVNGVNFGPIAAVGSTSSLTLLNPAPSTVSGGNYVIAPARATHIHIYRSESDGSKLGKFLGSIQIAGNANPSFLDNSPFQNQPGSTILDIDRPIRNDPAPASKIMETHKYRLWRRRENIPNRFNYTAYEEVLSGANGSPQESVPGADVNTLSDIINETAYPKAMTAIRAMKSHQDALYIGTESEVIPLWGDTIGGFALSQVTAIDGGAISRWGLESSSHGLLIFSYDRKLYLYPPSSPIWALTPQDINITDQLVEIGRPMRNKFLNILSSDIDNVRMLKYRYNSRDWVVISYQDKSNVYHTYVYDFDTKSWFELQRGFVSLAVFETSPGVKILVGGGSDGLTYVIDDVTGSVTPNATFPVALYRTSLIDFGNPQAFHIPQYLELEVSNPALMDSTTTINFYLDPVDADNPGTPIALTMSAVQGFPNLYRGWFAASEGGTGVMCKRLMIEFNLVSDTNSGVFRGVYLKADPIDGLTV